MKLQNLILLPSLSTLLSHIVAMALLVIACVAGDALLGFSTRTDCKRRLIQWKHHYNIALGNLGDNERGTKVRRQERFVKIQNEDNLIRGPYTF